MLEEIKGFFEAFDNWIISEITLKIVAFIASIRIVKFSLFFASRVFCLDELVQLMVHFIAHWNVEITAH